MPDISTILAANEFEESPLAVVYYNVLNELVTARLGEGAGSSKGNLSERRVALWVAWESHRTVSIKTEDFATAMAQKIDLLAVVGLPGTQKGFAALLGVNPRTLRNYAQKYGRFVSTAQEMGVQRVLAGYDLPALHALGLSAANPDSKHSSDRRTFFTMRGFLVERSDVTSGGKEIQPITTIIEERRAHSDE